MFDSVYLNQLVQYLDLNTIGSLRLLSKSFRQKLDLLKFKRNLSRDGKDGWIDIRGRFTGDKKVVEQKSHDLYVYIDNVLTEMYKFKLSGKLVRYTHYLEGLTINYFRSPTKFIPMDKSQSKTNSIWSILRSFPSYTLFQTFHREEEGGGIYQTGRCNPNSLIKQGKVLEYNFKGGIRSIKHYKDDKLEGKELIFYKNGILASKSNYRNGKLHGKSCTYFTNGSLQTDYRYKDGLIQGPGIIFYPDGSIKSIWYYKDSIATGTCLKYHPNGKISAKHIYRKDGDEEDIYLYYSNGRLSYKCLHDCDPISYSVTGKVLPTIL